MDRRDYRATKRREQKNDLAFLSHDFPERNLWSAVVHLALGGMSTKTKSKRSNSLWFFSPKSKYSMLPWICDNFGIDIEAVRREAKRRINNRKKKETKIIIPAIVDDYEEAEDFSAQFEPELMRNLVDGEEQMYFKELQL